MGEKIQGRRLKIRVRVGQKVRAVDNGNRIVITEKRGGKTIHRTQHAGNVHNIQEYLEALKNSAWKKKQERRKGGWVFFIHGHASLDTFDNNFEALIRYINQKYAKFLSQRNAIENLEIMRIEDEIAWLRRPRNTGKLQGSFERVDQTGRSVSQGETRAERERRFKSHMTPEELQDWRAERARKERERREKIRQHPKKRAAYRKAARIRAKKSRE